MEINTFDTIYSRFSINAKSGYEKEGKMATKWLVDACAERVQKTSWIREKWFFRKLESSYYHLIC